MREMEVELVNRLRKLLMLAAAGALPLPMVDQLRWDLGPPLGDGSQVSEGQCSNAGSGSRRRPISAESWSGRETPKEAQQSQSPEDAQGEDDELPKHRQNQGEFWWLCR